METQHRSLTARLTPGYRMPAGPERHLEDSRIPDISPKVRARYANIMYDTAFKLVFGSEANKHLLIELLETLIPGKKIADVSFHDREIPGYFVGDKKTVFDLYCTTERQETFIVEMQLHGQDFFTDRVLFYSTYPLLERIAFAFRHISFLEDRPESFGGEFFEHLFHAAELAGMTPDERKQYDKDMTTEIDKIAQMDYAFDRGVEKGLEQGREEGKKEGRKEGLVYTARNLKAEGIPEKVICQATGLTLEEVRLL